MTQNNKAHVEKAASLIQEAIDLLDIVYDSETWGTGKSDVAYFRNELEQFLSSDNGEAGLIAYLNKIKEAQ